MTTFSASLKTLHGRERKPFVTRGAAGVYEYRNPKVSMVWSPELFAEINRLAKRNGTSFAWEVRRLVVVGLRAETP